jgi:hypothetical protein
MRNEKTRGKERMLEGKDHLEKTESRKALERRRESMQADLELFPEIPLEPLSPLLCQSRFLNAYLHVNLTQAVRANHIIELFL